MSQNDTETSDNETNNISDILETEDVVITSNDDNCDISNMIESNNIIKKDLPIIEKNKRISKNKLTKYEFVRVIGERTKQLTMGAKPLIKENKKSEKLTYKEIALEELKLNMLPFKIKRKVKYHYEIWDLEELTKTHLLF